MHHIIAKRTRRNTRGNLIHACGSSMRECAQHLCEQHAQKYKNTVHLRVEDPGDDGEPGNLAVKIGDLPTPLDSSLAERYRKSVQHLLHQLFSAKYSEFFVNWNNLNCYYRF